MGEEKYSSNNETCKKFWINTVTIVKMRNDDLPQEMVARIIGGWLPDIDRTKQYLPEISSDVYKFNTLNVHSHSIYQYLNCARKLTGKNIKTLNEDYAGLFKCQN